MLLVRVRPAEAHGASSPKAIKNAIRVAADAARKNLIPQIAGGLHAVPEMREFTGAPGATRRGRLWQQLKVRFRRDGRADRNGDVRGEGGEEPEVTEPEDTPKRD